jgi:hypothetical protein
MSDVVNQLASQTGISSELIQKGLGAFFSFEAHARPPRVSIIRIRTHTDGLRARRASSRDVDRSCPAD